MQVSVETLKGLERKVTVSVPTEKIEEEVSQRLKNLARKAKVDGFRPGKVPMNVVVKRFSDSIRQEVARDMVQSTLYEALKTPSTATTIAGAAAKSTYAGRLFSFSASGLDAILSHIGH